MKTWTVSLGSSQPKCDRSLLDPNTMINKKYDLTLEGEAISLSLIQVLSFYGKDGHIPRLAI